MDINWIKIAGFMMFLAVALGAFGSHALKSRLSENHMDFYKTAIFYHFIHALGLFVIAWLATTTNDPKVKWAGLSLLTGIVLFSGSIYMLVLTKVSRLGYITPFGGLAFLIGWMLVVLVK